MLMLRIGKCLISIRTSDALHRCIPLVAASEKGLAQSDRCFASLLVLHDRSCKVMTSIQLERAIQFEASLGERSWKGRPERVTAPYAKTVSRSLLSILSTAPYEDWAGSRED